MDESVVKHLDQPQRTLKLSEAIRIGARIRPKTVGAFFEAGKSCAVGAALEALGVPYDEDNRVTVSRALRVLPALFDKKDLEEFSQIGEEIFALNDSGGKTREEIADWLEAQGY